MKDGTVRLDVWLWRARFAKNRSRTAQMALAGRLRVNGRVVVKSHHALRVGDVLTFAVGDRVRVLRVVSLGHRRGPATEARTLYDDLPADTREQVAVERLQAL